MTNNIIVDLSRVFLRDVSNYFQEESMKKLRMMEQNFLTLEDGGNKYLDNCRARNLRVGTIKRRLFDCLCYSIQKDVENGKSKIPSCPTRALRCFFLTKRGKCDRMIKNTWRTSL